MIMRLRNTNHNIFFDINLLYFDIVCAHFRGSCVDYQLVYSMPARSSVILHLSGVDVLLVNVCMVVLTVAMDMCLLCCCKCAM